MQIRCVLLSGLTLFLGLSLGLQAQESTPPKRPPQLTTDDLDNRSLSVSSSSRALPSPVSAPPKVVTPRQSVDPSLPSLADEKARAIVEAAWKKMTTVKSGRMQYTNQSPAGVQKMFYEFGAVDRGRIITEKEELIVIGQTAYVNEGGKGWKKTTKEEKLKSADIPFKFFANYSSALTTLVQLVGEETINQLPLLKFKVVEEDGLSKYTWVRKNDGLIYKVEASLANPERFIQAIYSDFNTAISIVPPKQ